LDPEILPEARDTTTGANTPVGDVAKASLDFSLSEEGEKDNISGNKELRDEGEHDDENNSKTPNEHQHPPTAE